MRKIALLLFIGSLAVSACADDSNPSSVPAPESGPGDFDANFKTSASFFTNMKALVPGTSPHGSTQTWYSTNIQELITTSPFTVPEGTVAIKEFDMAGDGISDGYAVMIKKAKGYDSANNDWYYDMRMLDGTIMPDPPAGKIAMCISCHQGYKSTDFLAATKMR